MTLSNTDAIVVSGLEKKFGDFVAVNRISFSVKKGEIFGFLGSNGSGKSTTIRMLCGIITPTSGSGSVAGFDILREPEGIRQAIGYMSQKFSLYHLRSLEKWSRKKTLNYCSILKNLKFYSTTLMGK